MTLHRAATRALAVLGAALALLLAAPAAAGACTVTYTAAVPEPDDVPGQGQGPGTGIAPEGCSQAIPLAGAAAVAGTVAVATVGYGVAVVVRAAASAPQLAQAAAAALPTLAPPPGATPGALGDRLARALRLGADFSRGAASGRAQARQELGPRPRRAQVRRIGAEYGRAYAEALKQFGPPPPPPADTLTHWSRLPVTENGRPVDRSVLNAPKPNSVYTANGLTYETDAQGRTVREHGFLSVARGRQPRNRYLERTVGRSGRRGDAGGHLTANMLGAPSEKINLVPQNHRLINNSVYKVLDSYFREVLRAGHTVEIERLVAFDDAAGVRPTTVHLRWTVNGKHRHEMVLPF